MPSHSGIEIVNFDEQWGVRFQSIKQVISKNLGDLIIKIEHVGSTSVRGLGAKPILDIDVVIENYGIFSSVIKGLERIGYFHQEDWSYEGREAFGRKDRSTPWDGKGTQWMEHHLHACIKDSQELARHLAFRDYLQTNPQAVTEYEKLKRHLAKTAKDRSSYTIGKKEFITNIVEKAME